MLTKEETKQFLDEDSASMLKKNARIGQKYYEADHDILGYRMFYYNSDGKLVEDEYRSNIKIPHPFFTELVDQGTQFTLSGADDGIIRSDDTKLQEQLDLYFNKNKKFMLELAETITGQQAKGFDYMHAYNGEDDRLEFENVDCLGVVEVEGRFADDGKDQIIYKYLDRIDKEEFTKRLKNLLEIRNKEEQIVTISEDHRREIKEYLDALDLTVDIDIQTLPVGRGKNFKTVFTQPGMRYSQAKELVQSLLEDGEFQELSIDERNAVIERILSDIKGRMMEDIVLLETKIANPKKQVFQLQFAVGEFDMVVADNANATCEIYEVKHSKEQAKEQFRHLIDEEKLKNTEFRYGKITKRTVIYRGENATLENGIEYRNVEDYLKSLL